MPPFLTGGDMISSVDFQEATWNELPWKFEAGTPPIAEAVGLGAAVEYLDGLGMERVREHERELTGLLLERPRPGAGRARRGAARTADSRGGLASFTVEGIHPHDVAELVSREGVCIRAGHHCAQPLMRCLGVARPRGPAWASTTSPPTCRRWWPRWRCARGVRARGLPEVG